MLNLRTTAFSFILATLLTVVPAQALDLDWHGQLRAETNWLWGYSNGLARPAPSAVAGQEDFGYGYSAFLNGESPAAFQNLFFALSPRVIVNDNVSIKSDLWLGTPDRGMFGGDQLTTGTFHDTRTGNATVTANTFYADMATDFGTITVGRAPLNWGLGVIWNYDKDRFYRLPSTGDVVRLSTKLGAFRFSPSVVKYRMGSNYGGTATYSATDGSLQTTGSGSSGVSDYSVALSYTNDDDQMDLGLLFLRRLAGLNALVQNPFNSNVNSGFAYNVWDFSLKKKTGIFTIAAEVPLVSGSVAGQDYSTVAGAAKIEAQMNDKVKLKLNLGVADGQADMAAGQTATKLTAFYFHPDYRPALILFNYNLRNFSDITSSPYDNPVTNARFLSLAMDYHSGKWSHELLALYAVAAQSVQTVGTGVNGAQYFNSLDSRYHYLNSGNTLQDKTLGFETDYSLGYEWDEAIQLGLNMGLLFPGKYYQFANSATPNTLKTVFASSVNVRVAF